jgi:hypothetical protein
MTYSLPPIVKLAERLLVDIEQAVRTWPRYHKYAHGAVLRAKAMDVAETAHRAWRDRPRQAQWTQQLVWKIDELKISLQLGSQIRAFASFAQFEALARVAHQLGRQAGGWRKQQSSQDQNAAPRSAPQRVKKLSTRNASLGANP